MAACQGRFQLQQFGVASGVATSVFGGKNSGSPDALLSEWCNLTPVSSYAMPRCEYSCDVTLLPCNQFH